VSGRRYGRRVDFRIEARPYDDPDVTRLVEAVQAEYIARYGGPDAAVVAPDEFEPPAGLFVVGTLDGEAVATGGWRWIEDGVAEIKRMYVVDSARRRGLARRILTELESSAGNAGARRMVLNTGHQQPEAIALYESNGYSPSEGFGHYACTPGAVFYGKDLDLTAQRPALAQGVDGPVRAGAARRE
jgi:GNAT superfamily N-acetyltransferase